MDSISKPKIAVLAAFLYTAIMGIAMFYMKTFQGITYGDPAMMNIFWIVLIILNVMNVFIVSRYFGWQTIGFNQLKPRQLLWLVPSIAVLTAMWVVFLKGLATTSLNAEQWQLLALAGFTTFLVGVGEETMYRGIVLHAFLTTSPVRWAMLVSAIAFSLLHAVNIFGGVLPLAVPIQLLFTFLFGFFFAPMMLKINNLCPLILFHWLWDFVIFASHMVGEQTNILISNISYAHVPIEIVIGTILWISFQQERDRVFQ